jgi:hypothetical protein
MLNVLQQPHLLRPWEKHTVTVCIPYLDTPEVLSLSLRLWQLQENRPFLLVVDTGSQSLQSNDFLTALSRERSVEVARLGILSEVEHRSDRVSIAMDYAFSRCPTEYLLATHVDVFPLHRQVIDKLLSLCNVSCPVVGWEMSPRGAGSDGIRTGTLARGIPGHACTMFHIPTMDRIGAGWSIRRAHYAFGLPRGYTDVLGWPDTEVCLGRILAAHGITPLLLGTETNAENQVTCDWVHARSSTVQYLLNGKPLLRQQEAYTAARARIIDWDLADARAERARSRAEVQLRLNGGLAHPGEAGRLAPCHSRREILDVPDWFWCAHPLVHVRDDLVTPEVCGRCDRWKQPPPETFRKLRRRRFGQPAASDQTAAIAIVWLRPAEHIDEALDTALFQSNRPSEVVVLHAFQGDRVREIQATYDDEAVNWVDLDETDPNEILAGALCATKSDVVCLLRADDRLSPRFVECGMSEFQRANVGLVRADVEYFDAPDVRDQLVGWAANPGTAGLGDATGNFEYGALLLRNAFEGAMNGNGAAAPERCDGTRPRDRILAAGWSQAWQRATYRQRASSHSDAREVPARPTECKSPGIHSASLTLFIPLAGRIALWGTLAEFLERQTWPHDRMKLFLLDTSHDAGFSQTVRSWIQACDYADVRYVHERVAAAGLADEPRVGEAHEQVIRAMVRIYSRLAREVTTEFVWVLEDDVLPPLDACERLLRGFDPQTASVSACYTSRFGTGYVAWSDDQRRITFAGTGLQPVGGNGFGCVVLRTSAAKELPFTTLAGYAAHDNAFYYRLRTGGHKAIIDWSVHCEHFANRSPFCSLPSTFSRSAGRG